MSTSLDIAALRARLREYDPALPHCKQRITREQNYAPDFVPEEERAEWDMVTYVPCYRPEGHEGVCRNTRLVLGFPGYDTVTALLDEVERLRELLLNAGWPQESEGLAVLAQQAERAAVVAWLRTASQWMVTNDPLNEEADAIERGEHRSEEKT